MKRISCSHLTLDNLFWMISWIYLKLLTLKIFLISFWRAKSFKNIQQISWSICWPQKFHSKRILDSSFLWIILLFFSDLKNQDDRSLALCLLYIQKNNFSQARHCLKQIDSNNLNNLLLEHWEILFDNSSKQQSSKGITNFSEIGDLIIKNCTEQFAHLLITLVMKEKILTISKLIKVGISKIFCLILKFSVMFRIEKELSWIEIEFL